MSCQILVVLYFQATLQLFNRYKNMYNIRYLPARTGDDVVGVIENLVSNLLLVLNLT